MEAKGRITNEDLGKKFTNLFDLVNYAILLSENIILTGRAPRVRMDVQNPALLALEEINKGVDRFEEVIIKPKEVDLIETMTISFDEPDEDEVEEDVKKSSKNKSKTKSDDKKRSRKILVE